MLWRRRRPAGTGPVMIDSAYARMLREQSVVWSGSPVSVVFEYVPYLRDPVRYRVDVGALLQSEAGELSIVGYCHEAQGERSFRIGSIRGDVLVERLARRISAAALVGVLRQGGFDD